MHPRQRDKESRVGGATKRTQITERKKKKRSDEKERGKKRKKNQTRSDNTDSHGIKLVEFIVEKRMESKRAKHTEEAFSNCCHQHLPETSHWSRVSALVRTHWNDDNARVQFIVCIAWDTCSSKKDREIKCYAEACVKHTHIHDIRETFLKLSNHVLPI